MKNGRCIGITRRILNSKRLGLRNFCQEQTKITQLDAISDYYGESSNADLYNTLWGKGNFHPGYFPHLSDPSKPKLNFVEAGSYLDEYMVTQPVAEITPTSKVIDFGCGKGSPAISIGKLKECAVTGIDLTPYHITAASQLLLKEDNINNLHDRIKFECGSFLGIDQTSAHYNSYTHVFSQLAINHVQNYFDDVCQSTYNVLMDDGKLIWSDFVGSGNGKNVKMSRELKSLLDRLHLPPLMNHKEYKQRIEANGFEVEVYESLDEHCAYAYEIVADEAQKLGKHDWAKKWRATAKVVRTGEFGMNFVIAKKRPC